MDGNFHIGDARSFDAARNTPAPSHAMLFAERALGGRKIWRGQVRGLLGLLRRGFDIQSTGKIDRDGLVFEEVLSFDDGETQKRRWRIKEASHGLMLEAEGVALAKPGLVKKDALIFVYRLNFGFLKFLYRDVFYLRGDGSVKNEGFASWCGLPVMKITAKA